MAAIRVPVPPVAAASFAIIAMQIKKKKNAMQTTATLVV